MVQLSDPIIWIWTAVYTNQINQKNEAHFCERASEIFVPYLLRSVFLVKSQAGSLQQPFKIELFRMYFRGFC